MCRILATMYSAESSGISELLLKFGKLANEGKTPPGSPSGHRDGWGLVAYKDAHVALYERNAMPATEDAKFVEAVRKISELKPAVIVGHLRKASGSGNKIVNTHPFVRNAWTFCHNGTVFSSEQIPLDPAYMNAVEGESDSEKLFFYFLQSMDGNDHQSGNILRERLTAAIRFIRDTRDYTAMNFILTDGETLLATHEVNEKNAYVQKGNLCESYYTLYVGMSAENKHLYICSEPLPIPGVEWNLMENHTILEAAFTKAGSSYSLTKI